MRKGDEGNVNWQTEFEVIEGAESGAGDKVSSVRPKTQTYRREIEAARNRLKNDPDCGK
jgi:hypothetical protein